MKRKALGRGLSALIPDSSKRTQSSDFFLCPIEKIKPSRAQPRQYFDSEQLQELVASIQSQGVIQPLVVRPGRGSSYILVVGERRWRAAQKAGLHEIPVVIRKLDALEAFEIALVENLHRADLDPIEEAEAYKRLLEEHDHTQEQLADRLGKDRSTVTNTLRLLNASASVQRSLRAGALTPGHVRAILALQKASLMDSACRLVVSQQLSVRQTELLVKKIKRGEPIKKNPPEISANVRDLQDQLSQSLKTSVRLKTSTKDKGRIEIVYSSLDELDRLLEVLLK